MQDRAAAKRLSAVAHLRAADRWGAKAALARAAGDSEAEREAREMRDAYLALSEFDSLMADCLAALDPGGRQCDNDGCPGGSQP